ncbi:extensin family protein [uncultured Maritimibacter sp.]|uniref:extensin family protein n=1 Tax=uncultured Maritimibacter sp. TaxID=991866 RepID=UPI002617C3D5|nr:extensin family protein [uncultured Maritimibacter sp.]
MRPRAGISALALGLCLVGSLAVAEAPTSSLVPPARPGAAAIDTAPVPEEPAAVNPPAPSEDAARAASDLAEDTQGLGENAAPAEPATAEAPAQPAAPADIAATTTTERGATEADMPETAPEAAAAPTETAETATGTPAATTDAQTVDAPETDEASAGTETAASPATASVTDTPAQADEAATAEGQTPQPEAPETATAAPETATAPTTVTEVQGQHSAQPTLETKTDTGAQTGAETASEEGTEATTEPAAPPVADETLAGIRPKPRPETGTEAPAADARPTLRPKPRPTRTETPAQPQVVQVTAAASAASALAVPISIRPLPRPENLQRRNTVVRTGLSQSGDEARRVTAGGSVCGRPEIKGVAIQPIPGKVSGCGLSDGVKVTSVSGIPLSTPITVDCNTAVTFNAWVGQALIPLVGRTGGGIREINIMASYACRPRNNQRGAKISEHGKGHAVDFGGFTLANGVQVSVLKHWSDSQFGPTMQALHKAACGPFGTVLGPKSDRYHQNHFHFDTASYRSGSYCR